MKKIAFFTILICALILSACSMETTRQSGDGTDDGEKLSVGITKDTMDDLENDGFYVLHKGRYYPLHMQNCYAEGTSKSSTDLLWFNEEGMDTIPTYYPGDRLVFYSNHDLEDSFEIKRYETYGYTIGVGGLKSLDSGRYYYDPTLSVNMASDAAKLASIVPAASDGSGNKTMQIIIDAIGKSALRSGNVTKGGTIRGLSKNKSYRVSAYVGTELKTYTVKADVTAMYIMEKYSVNDYTLLQSKILEINLPSYFNAGYYSVDDYGVFRYVTKDTYSESTDFNVPNTKPDEKNTVTPTPSAKDTPVTEVNNPVTEVSFTLSEDTDVTVTVQYGSENANYDMEKPVVKVVGRTNSYTLAETGPATISGDLSLDAGKYTIQITGLNGRSYKYSVVKRG